MTIFILLSTYMRLNFFYNYNYCIYKIVVFAYRMIYMESHRLESSSPIPRAGKSIDRYPLSLSLSIYLCSVSFVHSPSGIRLTPPDNVGFNNCSCLLTTPDLIAIGLRSGRIAIHSSTTLELGKLSLSFFFIFFFIFYLF